MIKSELTIINKLGLHARAASKFVGCASRYGSRIRINKDGQWADGKSIMSMMMLAAGKGTVLAVEIEGDDEHEAFTALQELLANYFGEGE